MSMQAADFERNLKLLGGFIGNGEPPPPPPPLCTRIDCFVSLIKVESQGPVWFDLSLKAEADQREQQDPVFNFAVLPVLSGPEPLEQRSNGSAP